MADQRRLIKDILFGRCPRCGIGQLFSGYLSVGTRCSGCELDFAVFDPGDGPAVFVILIEGALAMTGVLWVEFTFAPPLWVHAAIWIPTVSILTLILLRLIKSTLLVLQHRHSAGQGTMESNKTES